LECDTGAASNASRPHTAKHIPQNDSTRLLGIRELLSVGRYVLSSRLKGNSRGKIGDRLVIAAQLHWPDSPSEHLRKVE
jgi:hypothetical protein